MNYFIFLILIFFYFSIPGCSTNFTSGQKDIVSQKDELPVSNNIYPDAIWGAEGGGGEYYDPYLNDYLKEIARKFNLSSNRQGAPLIVVIQNTSVPNAWAIPGYVVITRGLLVYLQSEAEFAFVIGRELGHLFLKHSTNQINYKMLDGFSGFSSFDYDTGMALGIGSLSSGFIINNFSRNQEIDAVKLGVKYMSEMGYDPRNAVKAQINLEKANETYTKVASESAKERVFFNNFLISHPRTSIKIEEMQRIINNVNPPVRFSGDGEAREPFNNMLKNIRYVHGIYDLYYDRALRHFENNNFTSAQYSLFNAIQKISNQPCFFVLNGIIYLKKNDLNGADEYFSKAISINPHYQPALSGLGQLYYKKGYFENSIDYLREAVSLFPDDVISNLYLGMGFFKLQKYRDAISYLEKVNKIDERHHFANGLLGICYENIGDIQTAYNYYLKQVQINPNNEVGFIAQKKINQLKKK